MLKQVHNTISIYKDIRYDNYKFDDNNYHHVLTDNIEHKQSCQFDIELKKQKTSFIRIK